MATRILYARFGSHPPTLPSVPEMLTTTVPPLLRFGDHVDLDYTPLLLIDQGIIDVEAVSYLQACGIDQLAATKESIAALVSEGFLEPVSFRNLLEAELEKLAAAEQDELESYRTWVPLVQDASRRWRRISRGLKLQLGDALPDVNTLPFCIYQWLAQNDVLGDQAEQHRIEQLLFRYKPTTRNEDAQRVQRNAVKIYLANVHSVLVIAQMLDATWYDWSNMHRFYQTKFRRVMQTLDDDELKLVHARKFFDEAFVAFRPNNAAQLIRILKDRRIKDLRRRIEDSVATGIELDAGFAQRSLASLDSAKARVHKAVDIAGYLTIPLGLIPFVGSIPGKLIEKGVEVIARRKYLSKYQWMYFTGLLD